MKILSKINKILWKSLNPRAEAAPLRLLEKTKKYQANSMESPGSGLAGRLKTSPDLEKSSKIYKDFPRPELQFSKGFRPKHNFKM